MSHPPRDTLASYSLPSKHRDILEKIASVLGVQPEDLQNAKDVVSTEDYTTEMSLAAECTALIRAYTSISDPQKRLKYLNLIRGALEEK